MTDVDDGDVASVAEVLADDTARTILAATSKEPLPADELATICEVSEPTIYRRLEELSTLDLVDEQTRAEEAGHHYAVYAASLDRLVVELDEDGFTIQLNRRDRMADRFTQFIEDMREY